MRFLAFRRHCTLLASPAAPRTSFFSASRFARRDVTAAWVLFQVINFDAVIRHFGQRAVSLQLREMDTDSKALHALDNNSVSSRSADVRRWLRSCRVFQGFLDPERHAVTTAVLEWADHRDVHRDLHSVAALAGAHQELMEACTAPSERNATSHHSPFQAKLRQVGGDNG